MTPPAFRALFLRERRAFARAHPSVAGVGLALSDRYATAGSPGGFRDVAYADLDARLVVFVWRALALPVANLRGLIRHELGHLADRRADRPGAEQRADDLAARATGRRIRYDRRDMQTVGPGRWPRPRQLHR